MRAPGACGLSTWSGTGDGPGLEPHRPPPLDPPPAPRSPPPPPLRPGGCWRPSPHAPPRRPPSGCPTRGVSAGRACAQRRLPPAARGAGEVSARRPRPAPRRARGPSRGARHGGHRHRPLPFPPPAPSPAGGAGGAGRGARAQPPPFPARSLARSLPPSQLRWVTALASRAPAAGAAAQLF